MTDRDRPATHPDTEPPPPGLLLLDRALDGTLEDGERTALDQALAADAGLRAEAERLERLHTLLREERCAVDPAWTAGVLEALATLVRARARRTRSYLAIALAATSAIALVAAALLRAEREGGPLGALGALFDFVTSTALAGAGLLGASWLGVQHEVRRLIETSPASAAALLVVVLALYGAAFVLLRRPRRARAARSTRTD